MNLKWRGCFLFCVCVSFLFYVAGCENGGEDFAGSEDLDEVIFEQETEDIQLRVYIGSDVINHSIGLANIPQFEVGHYRIDSLIRQFVNEHFSNIQLTFYQERTFYSWEVENNEPREVLAELMEEGTPPDIIIDYTHQLSYLVENDLVVDDMLDVAPVYGLELNSFEQAFIDQLLIQQGGMLYALPLVRNLHAIRYYPVVLEDIDVSEPAENMTWEEYLDWLPDMYMGDSGPDFLGIEPRILIHQQEQSMVHSDNKEVLTSRSVWEKLVPIYRSITPRFPLLGGYRANQGNETWLFYSYEQELSRSDFDAWDLLPFPTFAEHPGISPDYVSDIIAPSAYTNHVEEAMQVIGVLVSEEFQTELSRIGLGSPLASPAVHEQFGAGTTEYEGKNVQAFFQHRPVATSLFSEQELQASQIIYPYLVNIYEGMDAETQLDLLLEELERTPFGGEN